jgi:4-hydroxy-3-methylbut-2-enyl diphosphate reductase
VWHNKYPLFAGLQSQGIYALVHRQFVTKVHKEVMHKQKQNHQVILIGHEGHPEVEGTLGQSNQSSSVALIETVIK